MSDYAAFLASKAHVVAPAGIDIDEAGIHPSLFPFQRAGVRWAVKRGRAALWFDCGLGKTRCQLEWARLLNQPTLILAPLAVTHQTAREAQAIGLDITYARTPAEMRTPITITNYERLDAFAGVSFGAVVLDESAILRDFAGKTRRALIARFRETPYRLCCTATPAPNDYLELGNHAEFLGIMSWAEMAATFFVHDAMNSDGNRGGGTGAWRLKGHAQEAFWDWIVSWGLFAQKPSDLGFDDTGFLLPPLNIHDCVIDSGYVPPGQLFAADVTGLVEQRRARAATIAARVQAAAEIVAREPNEQWIVWCDLNAESAAMAAAIPGAVEVTGIDAAESKEAALLGFADGTHRVLVSKPGIAGHGMNFQRCARMLFVGLGWSWEAYYQAIRRCYRFGQRRPVEVHIVTTDAEGAVVETVRRKERDAEVLGAAMIARMRAKEIAVVQNAERTQDIYERETAEGQGWRLELGDCVEVLRDEPDESVDFSIYSPPFASLYTYNASDRDMGNCQDEAEFFAHFDFLTRELLRLTKPGRLTACHVAQLQAMASRDGYIGIKDFRGQCIEAFKRAGWIHHGEIAIDKNPQAVAVRTKAKGLLFVQLRKDSSWMRPAIADFVLVFRAPGENAVPIHPNDVSNEDWIKWAHPLWTDIRETHTLSAIEGRDEPDEKHICALQLDVIDRCVRLWSNPGELVLDPFAGIGSTGYMAIQRGRRFVGVELKRSYATAAIKNLRVAQTLQDQQSLFAAHADQAAPE